MLSTSIKAHIANTLGASDYQIKSVGGGCINQTFCIETPMQRLFCKVNSASKFPGMFEKEKKGLELIGQQNIIKTPKVVDCVTLGDQQLLLLEWINNGRKTETFWKTFGQQLAKLHTISSKHFGLDEDNFMGSVVQINKKENDWNTFFTAHRLKPLINICVSKNLLSSKHQHQFEKVFERLPEIFTDANPSLVHGDLWSGNYMCDDNSRPVLIDTAAYFGHRSVDLAMTTLFGGFDRSFYEAYHYHYPLPSNYQKQWEICNLYPLLIHLLLFGKSYLTQIESTLKSYQ